MILQREEHHFKDNLSVVYNRVLYVNEYHFKDILSVVYNRAI